MAFHSSISLQGLDLAWRFNSGSETLEKTDTKTSVADPDPGEFGLKSQTGSGSVFGIRILQGKLTYIQTYLNFLRFSLIF